MAPLCWLSKSRQATFWWSSGVPLPGNLFCQLESEGKLSECAAGLLSGDLRVSYQLTPLLPPPPGPDPSFLLLFLQLLSLFRSRVSLFSLKAQLSSTSLALHGMNFWHQHSSTFQTIFTYSNLSRFQGPNHIANAPTCLFWLLQLNIAFPSSELYTEPSIYTYSSYNFLPGVLGIHGLALSSLLAAGSLKDDSLLYIPSTQYIWDCSVDWYSHSWISHSSK